jgi:hypothetical protein
MRQERTKLGQFYICYTDKPMHPIKTMDCVFYARNWANKVAHSRNVRLSVYQYIYETGQSVRLLTCTPTTLPG